MLKFASVIHLNARLHATARDFLELELIKAGHPDIEPCHGDLFACLFNDGPLPLTELAQKSGRSKSTVSVMVTHLERKGYLQKEKDPSNARSRIICLTQKGAELESVFNKISQRMQDKLKNSLADSEIQRLELLLSRALNSFQNYPAKNPVFLCCVLFVYELLLKTSKSCICHDH